MLLLPLPLVGPVVITLRLHAVHVVIVVVLMFFFFFFVIIVIIVEAEVEEIVIEFRHVEELDAEVKKNKAIAPMMLIKSSILHCASKKRPRWSFAQRILP